MCFYVKTASVGIMKHTMECEMRRNSVMELFVDNIDNIGV